MLGSRQPSVSKWSKRTRIWGCTAGAAGLTLLSLALPVPHVANAAPATAESCPTPDATRTAVHALLGQSAIRTEDLAEIALVDLGTRFAITVKGRTRAYAEPTRNCAQRARMAAVFVALTLAPPDIAEPDEPTVAAEPQSSATQASAPNPAASSAPPALPPGATPEQAPPKELESEWYGELDLAGQIAFDLTRARIDWGVLVRGVLSRTRWGTAISLDLPARSSFELLGMRVSQSSYTAELAIQRNWVFSGIRVNAELGPSLTLLQLKQAALPDAERVTRWLAGMRAGVYLTLAKHRLSPFVGAHLQLVPYRIPIIVEPLGKIGDTSILWFGASIGIALGTD